MRHREAQKIIEQILPLLPGFSTNKKGIFFADPIGHVIRGFLFDTSGYNKIDFHLCWFFMPIVRPIEYLTLSYGDRLNVAGHNSSWRTDMDDLPAKILQTIGLHALPQLREINTISDTILAVCKIRHSTPATETDINALEDIGCLQILDGQIHHAKMTLERIIAMEFGVDQRKWVLDIVERAKQLHEKLLSDPKLAIAQVKEWQDYTFASLKLEQWR